jgi:uncharacterized membrane protein YagU involved in acid resistance
MTTAVSLRPSLTKVIAGAGLLAGTLDIADAFVFYGLRGVTPVRILQGIAFALIGRSAFQQGMRSALLGLLLHFFIAVTVAAIYIVAGRRLPLSRHPLLFGALYGIGVYIVMNYVVLPLSHVGLRPLPPLAPFINGVAALVFCVGIPIALIDRRYSPSGRV